MLRTRYLVALALVVVACVLADGRACLGQAETSAVVSVQVDAGDPTGPYEPVWSYFGADEPNYSYAPNGQHLLKELSGLSPAPQKALSRLNAVWPWRRK